jgi:anti-sigma-K factor RskA
MTHDEAKHLLAPLARPDRADAIDVSDWVLRDVRTLRTARRHDDDAIIWRVAALCAGAAAIVVVGIATLATVTADENPLVEFAAAASTFAAEAR